MQITVLGKNLEITTELREYAEKKVAKIGKFFEHNPVGAQVTLSTFRGQEIAEITVQINGLLLRSEEKSHDMYGSIDGAVEKIERQVHKFKTRINRKLHKNRVTLESVQWQEEEAAPPQIKRIKRVPVKPMNPEEAVMQMDLLGHDFYVFSNDNTAALNVVYRRRDGNYGLIEPEG